MTTKRRSAMLTKLTVFDAHVDLAKVESVRVRPVEVSDDWKKGDQWPRTVNATQLEVTMASGRMHTVHWKNHGADDGLAQRVEAERQRDLILDAIATIDKEDEE